MDNDYTSSDDTIKCVICIIDMYDYIRVNGFMDFIKCIFISVICFIRIVFACMFLSGFFWACVSFENNKISNLLGIFFIIYGCICGISSYYMCTNNIYRSFIIITFNILLIFCSFLIKNLLIQNSDEFRS